MRHPELRVKLAHQLMRSTQANVEFSGEHQEGWRFSCGCEAIVEMRVHFQSSD